MRLVLIISLICTSACFGAKILGVYYHPGKSHHKLGEVLFKELARRGHEMVMVSPYPLKTSVKNYKDIDLPEVRADMQDRIRNDWFQRFSHNSDSTKTFKMLLNMSATQSELLFTNSEFKSLMKSGNKFDVCVLDWLFNESHLVFSKVFDCAIILSASGGNANNVMYVVGNPGPYSYVPYKYFPLTDRMNFYERVLNTLVHLGTEVYSHFYIRQQQQIINRYVPGAPNIDELLKSVAVIFSNSHFSYETNRPLVPNLIPVGGYHVEEAKPLPGDIKKFADDAKEGFIYFSLGSNMKSIFLDHNRQRGIIRAFSKLDVKVLWKFEGEIAGLPQHIKVSKWLPQNDVLAHPNIKMFITHGGLLSTIESIHHGVPMIGIPMFGDQNSNVPTGVEKGYSLQIKPMDLSEQTLTAAINEMLTNNSYTEKAKLHSSFLRNQPIKPMDKAIFWMEHVIRHKGADHLKNASMKLSWYEYFLVDVVAFILSVLTLTLCILYYTTKFIIRITLWVFKKRNMKQKIS